MYYDLYLSRRMGAHSEKNVKSISIAKRKMREWVKEEYKGKVITAEFDQPDNMVLIVYVDGQKRGWIRSHEEWERPVVPSWALPKYPPNR